MSISIQSLLIFPVGAVGHAIFVIKIPPEVTPRGHLNSGRFGIGNDFPIGMQVNFVLGRWAEEEVEIVKKAIEKAVDGTLQFCTLGLGFAMNFTNTDKP